MRPRRPRTETYRRTYSASAALGAVNYLTTVTGGGPTLPRDGLIFRALASNGLIDTIGLSTVSGTWPNSIVQAITGGPLENFGPFAGGAQVLFSTLPQDISNQFFWGDRGYAYYSSAQPISTVKRILDYLRSDAYVDYLYIGSEQLFVGGEPVAAIFGATL